MIVFCLPKLLESVNKAVKMKSNLPWLFSPMLKYLSEVANNNNYLVIDNVSRAEDKNIGLMGHNQRVQVVI